MTPAPCPIQSVPSAAKPVHDGYAPELIVPLVISMSTYWSSPEPVVAPCNRTSEGSVPV